MMANPSSIINLSSWKLTLPTGKKGKPTEVTQPKLNTYSDGNFNVSGSSVIFMAPTTGVTTSGSSYSRSELREMKPGGKTIASWSNKRTTRTMELTQAILEAPSGKPEVVAGQIHGASDDLCVLLYSSGKLYVRVGDTEKHLVDGSYTLGTYFTFRFKARPGGIEFWYNGVLKHTMNGNFSGLYFKAGCYTQANKTNGSGRGRVGISSLTLDGAAPAAPPVVVPEDTPRPAEPDPPPANNPCGA